MTNLSWDNAAIMSINTMADLKLDESDPVKVSLMAASLLPLR